MHLALREACSLSQVSSAIISPISAVAVQLVMLERMIEMFPFVEVICIFLIVDVPMVADVPSRVTNEVIAQSDTVMPDSCEQSERSVLHTSESTDISPGVLTVNEFI